MMIRREDNRFKPVKTNVVTLVRMYLETEGWSIFSTDYDYEFKTWVFHCEYTKNDGNYDVNASYSIEVNIRNSNNIVNPDITINPPILR